MIARSSLHDYSTADCCIKPTPYSDWVKLNAWPTLGVCDLGTSLTGHSGHNRARPVCAWNDDPDHLWVRDSQKGESLDGGREWARPTRDAREEGTPARQVVLAWKSLRRWKLPSDRRLD